MLRVVCCTICMYKNKHVLETKRILRGVLWYATVQDPVYHSEMYLVVPLSIPKKTQAWMLRPPKKSRPQMLNARDACQCVITVSVSTPPGKKLRKSRKKLQKKLSAIFVTVPYRTGPFRYYIVQGTKFSTYTLKNWDRFSTSNL